MTQPTSVNATFDTSLIDLNASFSTTESDPSITDAGPPTTQTPDLQPAPFANDSTQETPKQSQNISTLAPDSITPPPKPSTPVQHLPTQDAYNQWASIYDTDGNMLQAIDDVELNTLLPSFVEKVLVSKADRYAWLHLLDLGCGTGRNTAKLASYAWSKDVFVRITGLDFSTGMLEIAKAKLAPLEAGNKNMSLRLEQCDCFPTVSSPTASPIPSAANLQPQDALISTLVLEHVPLEPYFATLSSLLSPSGYALVTNMHSEMGRISQAGFVNKDGVKVRGESFAHTVQETVDEAERQGFEVLDVRERKMEEEDVRSGRVGERGRKWVGVRVWYGMVVRKA